jgi:hypothetical protein
MSERDRPVDEITITEAMAEVGRQVLEDSGHLSGDYRSDLPLLARQVFCSMLRARRREQLLSALEKVNSIY